MHKDIKELLFADTEIKARVAAIGAALTDKYSEATANGEEVSYYKAIALKYCDLCREKAYKQGDSLRMYNFRQRQKQQRKAEKTRLQLLEEENELLRARIIKLREEINDETI